LPGDGAAKRRADAFGEILLDQFGDVCAIRSTTSFVCGRVSRSGRKLRMISDKCAERTVVGSTTMYPAADARSRCSVEIQVAESPNAGSPVEVPSRLDAAVPGLIARRRSG